MVNNTYHSTKPRKLEYEEILASRLTEENALTAQRHPVIGVLEDIRSLYNVGSCFRTADALLLQRLVLTGYTPHPPRKEISKTALGAERSVPWERTEDRLAAVKSLREEKYTLWGLELAEGATPLDKLEEIPNRIALVIGNEISGICSETLALCDGAISIPMYGVKHSLNIAVAFGIAMWHLVTQMKTDEDRSENTDEQG
ncbi:MAG: RNA methyltransferase [Chlorobi bacterium]|nr:RNA methyltransferase [Chlorobiota bacterium]